MGLKLLIFPRSLLVLVLVAGLVILHSSTQLDRFERPNHQSQPQRNGTSTAKAALANATRRAFHNLYLQGPLEGCLDLNSRGWVDGPRHGNEGVHFGHVDASKVLTQPISDSMAQVFQAKKVPSIESKGDALSTFLSQSLCHERSRFRDIDGTVAGDNDLMNDALPEMIVRSWTTRLIYLAMIHHQQRYSLSEALLRYAPREGAPNSCQTYLEQEYGIGPYDFECPGAKFIIASLADIGVGANVRGGMIEALLAGLVSDRVVLFVNNAPVGHRFLRQPWALVSCPRRDYQCFFFPPSPCVLSHKDIQAAYRLTKAEAASLRLGDAPKGPAHERVWHLTLSFTPQQQIPLQAAQLLYNHSMTLLRPLMDERGVDNDPRRTILLRAARRILQRNESRRAGYNYGAANLPIHHALAVFATRPNPYYALKLSGGSDVPQANKSDEMSPDLSVGLPIRGKHYEAVRRVLHLCRFSRLKR